MKNLVFNRLNSGYIAYPQKAELYLYKWFNPIFGVNYWTLVVTDDETKKETRFEESLPSVEKAKKWATNKYREIYG